MYFQLISLWVYSNFEWKQSLAVEFNSSSKEYPFSILSMDTATLKMRNTWKTWLQLRFSCISHFSCSMVYRKYATWVLLGWEIKFFIQRVFPLEIWVKTLGDKLKIRVEKLVLLFYYFLIFLLFYTKNGESSPMVDIIIFNPIGSHNVYFGCTFFLGGPF